ncbi:neuronal acetylcholine receptor subunit alpha-3-like [Physella acuta]|uniref:neuronal acetylcholine receptor subunit alpha-3-like n=1 Tax=Physella acuta TaxID=109671 RepID=UPI0027DB7E20|nr:neuronal acetylcholine receptor subunit alpha-3-like [Physella acuta]
MSTFKCPISGCATYNKTLFPSIASETRLLKDLLQDYDKRVRPAQRITDTVITSFGLGLKSLLYLDEKREYMETVSYMLTSWHDGRLMWNASQYGGIDSLKIPANQLWTPDLVPDTSIDEDVSLMDTMAMIYPSGHVTWIPTLHLRSPCSVNLRTFPFDEQKCSIRFSSYIYHGDHLNITYYGGTPDRAFDVSDHHINTNWVLLDHRATIHVIKHPCCNEPYPHMQFDLTFKRNPDYYVHVFVLPALLLALLVPISLLMPPESKERVTIGSVVVLGVMVLDASLCEVLPMAYNQLPAISIYYTLTMFWAVLSLMGSAFVLNLHNRGPRRGKVPDAVRWIFLRSLKRLVCLGNDSYYPLTDLDTISMRGLDKTITCQDRQPSNSDLRGINSSKVEKDIEEVNRNLSILSAKIALQDARQEVLNEWRQVALVVDRVLFFLFLLVFLMCSVILLA